MQSRFRRLFPVWVALCAVLASLVPMYGVGAGNAFADTAFARVWGRTDGPVAARTTTRTFLWGPAPIGEGIQEKYAQSPGGTRLVQYFDKSRMEITNPSGDAAGPFYVTNGLLVTELMTGKIQISNDPKEVELRDPAVINVAGDAADTNAPTYQTLARLRDLPARSEGAAVRESVDRSGAVTPGGGDSVTASVLVPETRHAVASVFWSFMNSSGIIGDGTGGTQMGNLFPNPFFATGFPVTEAYWTTVRVGGASKQVLIQGFERRVLTYTPDNPPGFTVEAGNVGQHYYQWRYQSRPAVIVDPSVSPGPIQPVTLLMGKYNLVPSDLPERFGFRFDGEITNAFLAKNANDPAYANYLTQWQRMTGYRRTFTRAEQESQTSTIQSIVSVYRTRDGAQAAILYDRDRLRSMPNITILDGPYGTYSYLKTDTSNGVTIYSVHWAQGNVLSSIEVVAAPNSGLKMNEARELAQEQFRRLNLDIP